MLDCKAVEAACVSQVTSVEMCVPYATLCTALFTVMLFYSSVSPKQISSSSDLEAEQRLLLAEAVSRQGFWKLGIHL